MSQRRQRPAIARIWRGRTTRERADAYEAYHNEAGIKPLIDMALGVQAMTRFAGGDPTRIHHLDRDAEFLIELPERVQILAIRASQGDTGGE